jgi:hypothetical protein
LKNFSIISILLLIAGNLFSQELRINVIVDDNQYQLSANKDIFRQMKSDIENFVNNRRWTKDKFEEHERIACNLLLTIQGNSSQNRFNCQAQIQSSRTVYGSAYQTVLLNYPDRNFNFSYLAGQAIEYNDNSYTNELSTLLAFYSYVILGMDYDSFSLNGGKEYYLLANQAMNNNPNATVEPGWSNATTTDASTSRYWLIENAINAQYLNYHKGLYDYHRLGLDMITKDKTNAHKSMLNTLVELEKIKNVNQSGMLITYFMLAKRDEIISVFSGADAPTKQQILPILRVLDPVYFEKYQKILK